MFYKVKSLKGYALDSLDGPVGGVDQFYFDDSPLTYEYEEALHRFHKLPGYWAAEAAVRS